MFVLTTESKAAAAVRIGAALALGKRGELAGLLRPCFARTQVWLQASRYVAALMSELPERNGWSIARHAGDRTPDKTQRLLNHARWDTLAAMGIVRRFAVDGLDEAARRNHRQGGMRVGALDETGQEKQGRSTAGVKRQYLGCAGRVANGINTVHLSYVRQGTGHAADRRPAVDPPGAGHRSRAVAGHGTAAGPAVPHQRTAGHRRLRRRVR